MANLMLGQDIPSTAVEVAKKSPMEIEMAESKQNIAHVTKKLDSISVTRHNESKFTFADVLKKGIVQKASENKMDNSLLEKSNTQKWLGDPHKNMPGCYPCSRFNNCVSSNCNWCVRGFCQNGPLCSNIYAQYIYYEDVEEDMMPNTLSTIKLRSFVGKPWPHKVMKVNKNLVPSKQVLTMRVKHVRTKCMSKNKNKKYRRC